MAKLVVWRHGQTDYNLQGRVQGVTDISLNAAGLAQAAAAAPIIAAYKPVKIIASPLERAQQTAQALAKLTGVEVTSDERLIERSFGIWEGLSGKEIKADWPQEFKQWRGECATPSGIGMEERDAVGQRSAAAMRDAVEGLGTDDTVVLVAHSAVLTMGATCLLGLDPNNWSGLLSLGNCAWGVLSNGLRPPGWAIRQWNVSVTDSSTATPVIW